MITLNNINKYYNSGNEKYHALRNINVTFPNKGMIFIVGKSGSGKSTLLNVIGGIDSYDSGELIIDDINTKNFSKSDYNTYRNSYIGFIFQEFNVVKNLNVYENIALSLRLQNQNIKENNDLILETIKSVGLEGKERRKMNQLSGGERQRVAIARAIIKNPKVIIADEPTGNLDKNNRDIVMNTLKELSKNQLVIVVTHDKTLSDKYGDEKIEIKDGQIINHTKLIEKEKINDETEEPLINNKIIPSIKAPIFLSLKSLKQNLFRFIMITIFFIVALVFSNTTINLYFSNATLEYAQYQQEYDNEYICISQQETIFGEKVQSGFFQIDTLSYKNLITSLDNEDDKLKYQIFHCFSSTIPINQNVDDHIDNFYSSSIDNVVVIEDITEFEKMYSPLNINNTLPNTSMPVRCYITDYIADSLIINNYFKDNANLNVLYADYFADKYITVDGFAKPIYIEGVINTNYKEFLDKDLDDPNVYTSFTDNKIFYNSIFFRSSVYVGTTDGVQFVSTSNMKYIYDDFIYSGLNKEGTITNVKVSYYDETCKIIKGKAPKKHQEGEFLDQIVISTALLEQTFGVTIDDLDFGSESNPVSLINPDTGYTATFSFYGYHRVNSNFNCEIVGIVDSDEPTLYFCNPSETSLYYNYIKMSYSDYDNSTKSFGGKLIVKITDNVNLNTSLYQTLRDNDIIIDNLSYTKLQVVNSFIDNNLILFIGIFFALCMFSILMIFNFVVITIKNSTKDIGIYMSLGMNGMQIAFIYILQILLISTITFIVSTIGAAIFLNILDTTLSADASAIINAQYNLNMYPIDFETFKMTSSGILISMFIAYIFPLLSVIIPLFNLAKKKPIDVLKIS